MPKSVFIRSESYTEATRSSQPNPLFDADPSPSSSFATDHSNQGNRRGSPSCTGRSSIPTFPSEMVGPDRRHRLSSEPGVQRDWWSEPSDRTYNSERCHGHRAKYKP